MYKIYILYKIKSNLAQSWDNLTGKSLILLLIFVLKVPQNLNNEYTDTWAWIRIRCVTANKIW